MAIKFIKEHIFFLSVLFACIALRLIPLFDYQFTLDELSGLDRTRFNSFGELIEKGVKIDAHPALVQIVIYYLSRCFGYVNWIIKLPFLLCSFGAIVYAYFFCLRNFSKQVAIIAAVIFSFSLVFVFYAPIARMYISGVFFSMALLFYFYEIFFLKNLKKSNYFFLGLFALLSALNQHINALFAFTLCAAGICMMNKNNFKNYLITLIIVVLAYLPHLPVTLYQLSIGGIGYEQGGWLEKPSATAVFGFFKIVFGTGKTYFVFLFLIIASFVLNRKLSFNKQQAFLLIIFLINYLIVYIYSIFTAPIFQNSVMLFSGVALVVFISSLLDFKNKYAFTFSVIIIVAALIFKTYYKKDYYHQCVKTIFEYQFERTFELKAKYGNENVFPVFFDADEVMKGIYFKKYKNTFDCKIPADSVTFSVKKFSEFISTLKTNYIVLASSYPLQQAIVSEFYPYLVENTETQGINYKVYSNRVEDKNKIVPGESVIYTANLFDKKDFTFKNDPNLKLNANAFQLAVDSTNEYPFDATAQLNKITSKEGQVILFKTSVKPADAKWVAACISINDLKKDTNYNFNSMRAINFMAKPDSSINLYVDAYCGTNYEKIKNTSKCTVFVWNMPKEKFILTGFEIKVIDYWPQKWNFWE